MLDPQGPLVIAPAYALRVAPWLWRFWRNTSLERVNAIADAPHALLDPTIVKWRTLAAWAGVPELIRQDGYGFAYRSEAGYRSDALSRELRKARGVEIDVLTDGAIRDFEATLSAAISHMMILPEQGHVPNPLRLSQALASRLRAGGATFVKREARGFELGNGRVTAIATDQETVSADAVMIAAGAHSNRLSSQLGSSVPLATERG